MQSAIEKQNYIGNLFAWKSHNRSQVHIDSLTLTKKDMAPFNHATKYAKERTVICIVYV